MDKERELAGKVDALIGKRGAAPPVADDRNIPVLTDVVEAPAWPRQATNPKLTTPVLAKLGHAEIDALSNAIFSRVMDRIDSRLANQLEDRLSALFATQLNSAVTSVMADMRQDIANEIGDAVNAALADHLRSK